MLGVDLATGTFQVRVDGFEDTGAQWRFPLRDVTGLRFPAGSVALPAAARGRLADADARYGETVVRPTSARSAAATSAAIRSAQERASRLLREQLGRAPRRLRTRSAEPDERLMRAWAAFAEAEGCSDIDHDVASAWVSNPDGYETVKAHMIVMARMGLVRYAGPELRDPTLLRGGLSARARRGHVAARLGFVRAFFALAGLTEVDLWRGFVVRRGRPLTGAPTLLGATFDGRVAREHFTTAHPDAAASGLHRSWVDVDRLFMTYLETPALSEKYHESEAVLLGDPRRLI